MGLRSTSWQLVAAAVLLALGLVALGVTYSADEAFEEHSSELLQGVEFSKHRDEAIFARRGGLEKMAVKMQGQIPTLDFSQIKTGDLKPATFSATGSALKTSLAGLVRGLARRHEGHMHHQAQSSSHAHKTQSLDYSDPNHHEPYNKAMETEEWFKMAKSFRASHPLMDAKEEQKQMDDLWRKKHPYFYHAYGPVHGGRGDSTGGTTTTSSGPPPLRSSHPGARGSPAVNNVIVPLVSGPAGGSIAPTVNTVHNPTGDVPETVLAPVGDGVHDFDGNSAIIATIPRLGEGPSKLDDKGQDARGTFLVRVYGASGQPELMVKRTIGGLGHPFKCKYRAYRKLSGDFSGNVVYTGFMRAYSSSGDEILTGMSIPPSGNKNEFDIMTCRDTHTGEVQYFKLRPELILARMRSNHCAGYIPSGSIGDCGW